MECAFFGVPTVTLYKTSWATYEIGKRIVKVKSLTMPNLLAGESVRVSFRLDKAMPPGGGDRRELGVIVLSASLTAK